MPRRSSSTRIRPRLSSERQGQHGIHLLFPMGRVVFGLVNWSGLKASQVVVSAMMVVVHGAMMERGCV